MRQPLLGHPAVAVGVLFLALLASRPGPAAAATSVPFTAAGDYSEEALLRGVSATQAQCAEVSGTVWADAGPLGQACIKYWTAGFPTAANGRAIVFFHGDLLVGKGKTAKGYLTNSPQKTQRDIELTARKLDAPYVFIGRPGTHGSSGQHTQRRRAAESALLSDALDQLRQRLNIREFVIAGQSGGGHVTAALLTRRKDIVCAVPTSSPSSPRLRWTLMGLKKDTTGFNDSYEPAEHLDKARMHPGLRVFVLGDPTDKKVPWASQTILSDRLLAIGVPVKVLQGQGAGPESHGLPNSGREVASWCFRDLATDEIVRRAGAGLKG